METSDVDNSNRGNPFQNVRVFLSGEFPIGRGLIENLLRKDGAIIDEELTRETWLIINGGYQPDEDRRRQDELLWRGYEIPIITDDELMQLHNGEIRSKFQKPQKDFSITFHRLFNLTYYSPFIHLYSENTEQLLPGKTIYMPYNEREEVNQDSQPYLDAIRECLRRMDVRITNELNGKTDYCWISEETIEKLKIGKRDNFIRVFEYRYNLPDSADFTYLFFREREAAIFLLNYAAAQNWSNISKEIGNYIMRILAGTAAFLSHYTDLNALPNILQKGKIVFRATNILYLNDPNEGIEALRVYRRNRWGDYLYLDELGEMVENSSLDFYVTSFCRYDDILPMWAMYADNGKGCALEFDGKALTQGFNNGKSLFLKCNYSDDDVFLFHEEVIFWNTVRNQISGGRGVAQLDMELLADILTCLSTKHWGYVHECERRGVFIKTRNGRKQVKYRMKNHFVVPYVEIEIPTEALARVILGPSTDDLSEKSIKHLLKTNGYNNVKVVKSELPYRG